MDNILIFGNSGSGKSTLAKKLSAENNLAHLDLDTLAWQPTDPPERKPIAESKKEINDFIGANSAWVIEGCYTDLLDLVAEHASEIIFLSLPVAKCIANARKRPWEPHKYDSKEAQDNNLQMLIDWIAQYPEREDTFSEAAHKKFYEEFTGKKSTYNSNKR